MRTSEVYGREPGTIAAARLLTTAFLARVGERIARPLPQRTIDNARLVVSELVTNAVKYTTGAYGIDLELADGHVLITVWDTSPQAITPMAPDPGRVGQHGMEIVLALYGSFDAVTTPTGKRITVRVDLSAAG